MESVTKRSPGMISGIPGGYGTTMTAATRDFRDSKWTAIDATRIDDGFVHKHAAPADGYAAILGEAVFHEGTDNQFWLSTNVRIVPSNTKAAGN